ncbi:hypothetical protein SCB49_12664 [unidentified eubacterium SCB49]|nr:hypothetical protein SCB49_12664 [unidentified eubacterium SCB49]
MVIVLSIPAVQTKIAKRVTDTVNETYDVDINIDRIGLNWRGEVDVREVYIADHHQDTLIYAQELQADVLNFKNLLKDSYGFGDIFLKKAKLHYKTYKDEERDNLYIFSQKFNTGKKSTNVFVLFADHLELDDSEVYIIDENKENPEMLMLDGLSIDADDFRVEDINVTAKINDLSVEAQRGFKIEKLQTNFSYTSEALKLEALDLVSSDSELKGDLIFNYTEEEGMSDFMNGVVIDATFDDSKLATNDLNTFYNEFGLNQILSVNGKFNGTLNDFVFNNVKIQTGDTSITGNFTIKDLISEDKEYSIQAKSHDISTNYYDLRRFMPRLIGENLPEQLKSLGNFKFSGTTNITTSTLKSNSILKSTIGHANVDVEMGQINDFESATYKGRVEVTDFDLGKLTETSTLGKISAKLRVKGSGFSQKSVNTSLKGRVSSFDFEGYTYKNITVTGTLKDPVFNGDLSIDDPNVKLDFKGMVDVSKEFNQFDFEADVEYAELNKLNLMKRDSVSVFAGRLVVDMDGTTIDDATGTINFKETFYQNERDDYYFDDFNVVSSFEGEKRTIEVNSPDIIDGSISGIFTVEDIPNLFINGIGKIYANYIPQEVSSDQFINYNFTVYNKIVELFVPSLSLGENTKINGSVSSDETKFKLNFNSPEILLYNNYLGNIAVAVDNSNPLYNTYIEVDSVYTGVYDLKNVAIINKTINDTLYVRSEFAGGKTKEDVFNLALYHTINPEGKSVVGFSKSDIKYNDNIWYVNKENNKQNKIVFDDTFKNIEIEDIKINHKEEFIDLKGVITDSTYKDLKVRFTDVNIGNLVPKIDSLSLGGNITGDLNFLQKGNAYFPNSNVKIEDVVINDTAFGDLTLDIQGNEDLTNYKINTTLVNNDIKSISAVGDINVSNNDPQIALDVALNDFNLKAFSPFGGDVITDIRGLVSGNAIVKGNYKSPDVLGRLVLKNSGMNIVELNTNFNIDDNTILNLTKDKITIEPTGITDAKYKTKGLLSGNARHNNFLDWALNLRIDAPERLLALDKPFDEDALYYGTAYISGNATIVGPIQELTIDVEATTEKGTTFKIPISETESIGDDSFVRFISPEEKEARISGEEIEIEEIKGLTLNFELDINQNAEVEVVVDQTSGSTLTGRGAGILLIEINTLGKFNMWGDFLVISGDYDFRYGGLIQKEIEVESGGSITWDGKPEKARLDLKAIYKTYANPSPLLDNPTANRKIEVEVIVELLGELSQPDLNFDIEFPSVSSIVKTELEYKLQNEEQRQNQAIFLMASDSFVTDDFAGAGGIGGNLLADQVSNILGDLLQDKDGKISLAIDYQAGQNSPTIETANELGVTISANITDKLLINGTLGVPIGDVEDTAVAGEVAMQWLVNEDGSLRMNFFRRQADVQFIGEDQIFEQGFGLSYSVDFNTFKELVFKLFNKKLSLEQEQQEELPVVPDDNTIPDNFGTLPEEEN